MASYIEPSKMILQKLNGYLDDYSYLINSLIDIFEITSDAYFLDMAQKIANYMIEHFWNDTEKIILLYI